MAKTGVKKRIFSIALGVMIFLASVLAVLQIGVWYSMTWKHWRPSYEKVDISPILEKETLTDEDYDTLYRQTGLTKIGIDDLLVSGNSRRILEIQYFFFSDVSVGTENFAPFTNIEYSSNIIPTGKLKNGDILLTATTYTSFFRFGHSALVVDGDKNVVLESYSPGTLSRLTDVSSVTRLANLIVVRPKCEKTTREKVVAFAKDNLLGIPYSLTTGIFSKKYTEEIPKVTQCTHIVWYAYKKYGVDLDSNGGLIAKPRDIARSSEVEVVQVYGFDLDRLWG